MRRVAQGLDIGAHDYILRPVDRNEFLARVRTQIRRKRFQDKLRANYETSLSMARFSRDPCGSKKISVCTTFCDATRFI